jgi:hypothetical protein
MAREVAATAEVDARRQASDMVRQHGRRKAEELAWEYSDRCKAQGDKNRYEAWQAVIRNIVDRTEHPAIENETRVPVDHGIGIVTGDRVPPDRIEMRGAGGKLLGTITHVGDGKA